MSPGMPVSPQKCSPNRAPRRNAAELSGRGGRRSMSHLYTVTGAGTWGLAVGKGEARGETRKSAHYLLHFHFEQVGPGEKTPWPRSAETWLESQLSPMT